MQTSIKRNRQDNTYKWIATGKGRNNMREHTRKYKTTKHRNNGQDLWFKHEKRQQINKRKQLFFDLKPRNYRLKCGAK